MEQMMREGLEARKQAKPQNESSSENVSAQSSNCAQCDPQRLCNFDSQHSQDGGIGSQRQNDLVVERVLVFVLQSDRYQNGIIASCRTPQAEASEASGQSEPLVVNDSGQVSISTTVQEGQESPLGDTSNEHCEVSNTGSSVGGDGTSGRQEIPPLPPPPPTQVRLSPL